MRLFTSESLFNVKTGQWEERFWIEGNLVDADLYFFELEREKELETAKLLKEIEIEEDCLCDCYECTIERYTDLLSEMTGGCPGCIREVLKLFCDEIVEHIIVEDMDQEDLEGNTDKDKFIGFLKSLDDRVSALENK